MSSFESACQRLSQVSKEYNLLSSTTGLKGATLSSRTQLRGHPLDASHLKAEKKAFHARNPCGPRGGHPSTWPKGLVPFIHFLIPCYSTHSYLLSMRMDIIPSQVRRKNKHPHLPVHYWSSHHQTSTFQILRLLHLAFLSRDRTVASSSHRKVQINAELPPSASNGILTQRTPRVITQLPF